MSKLVLPLCFLGRGEVHKVDVVLSLWQEMSHYISSAKKHPRLFSRAGYGFGQIRLGGGRRILPGWGEYAGASVELRPCSSQGGSAQ